MWKGRLAHWGAFGVCKELSVLWGICHTILSMPLEMFSAEILEKETVELASWCV